MRILSTIPIAIGILLLSLPSTVSAQQKAAVSGIVADMNNTPVSFTTVRVYREKDSATVTQTSYTKEDGKFKLALPVPGNFILVFSHIAHDVKKQKLALQPGSNVDLGTIQLAPKSGTMNNVVITAQRPLIEQNDDKIVFNVEDDPAAKTETAIDILRKTPFVSVDGEDNILINGKSNFRVLLNGKETSMFAKNVKDALRAFPGAMIAKIEVITTPSAKYDGEGIGGLINIITKKKVVGYNGTISTFNRSSDKLNNFSVNGNAKLGKLGLSVFFNQGFSDPVLQQNNNTTIPTSKDIYSRRTLDGDQYASANWNFGNAELSYEIDSLNTLSVYTNIDSWTNKVVSDQTITTEFTSSPATVSKFNLNNKSRNPGVNVGSDFIKHFKSNK